MPVTKASQRSAAAKERRRKQLDKKSEQFAKKLAKQIDVPVVFTSHDEPNNGMGSGKRVPPEEWDTSEHTGKQHKLLIPVDSPDKKFVLIAGDSHLRPIAEQAVLFAESSLSFGISCSPGANAKQLKAQLVADYKEVVEVHHKEVELLCLLAPSNEMTSAITIERAVKNFRSLLLSVCSSKWKKVCVVDFPPRLNVDKDYQAALHQAFHRVAVKFGISYHHIAEHFPLSDTHLWSDDNIHLSDTPTESGKNCGIDILVEQLYDACKNALRSPPASVPQEVSYPTSTSTSQRRVSSRVVVKRDRQQHIPRSRDISPSGFEYVGPESKRMRCVVSSHSRQPSSGNVQQMTEYGIPLSHTVFNAAMAEEMERISPSQTEGTAQLPIVEKISSVKPTKSKDNRHRGKKQASRVPTTENKQTTSTTENTQTTCSSCSPSPEACQVPTRENTPTKSTTENTQTTCSSCSSSTENLVMNSSPLPTTMEEGSVSRMDQKPTSTITSPHNEPNSSTTDEHNADDDQAKLSHFVKPEANDTAAGCLSNHTTSDVEIIAGGIPSIATISDVADCNTVSQTSHPVNIPKNLKGSFHQGSQLLLYPGSQCMPIALVSLAQHEIKNICTWTQNDLDHILILGDEMYSRYKPKDHIFMSVGDLPKQEKVNGHNFKFVFGDAVTGDVQIEESPLIADGVCVTLNQGLTRILNQYNSCLLTLCSNTIAIIKHNNCFAIVDSHARSATGLLDTEGQSVVVYFSCFEDLYRHIHKLAACLDALQQEFEIQGVRVHLMHTQQCMTDFIHTDLELDVQCIGHTTTEMYFKPLPETHCRDVCMRLNIDFEKTDVPFGNVVGLLGSPCKTVSIVADGNCFFRSISQAISGTQKYHRKFRLATVNQLKNNPEKYKGLLRESYSSIEEYLQKSNMHKVNVWATEVEIQALADYLTIDIYTYNRQGTSTNKTWLKTTGTTNTLMNYAVYLDHCNGNHYEAVVCVSVAVGEGCYNFCQTTNIVEPAYTTRSKTKSIMDNNSMDKEEPQKLNTVYTSVCSQYIKRKKSLLQKLQYIKKKDTIQEKNKLRYHQDPTYHQLVLATTIHKYATNIPHQNMLKLKSVQKYAINEDFRRSTKAYSIKKYAVNNNFREHTKAYSIKKYAVNNNFREHTKAYSIKKYAVNNNFREHTKAYSIKKYAVNNNFREHTKAYSIKKYAVDNNFRENTKAYSISKYNRNEVFRQNLKDLSKSRYSDPIQKKEIQIRSRSRKERIKENSNIIENVTKHFLDKIHHGPQYVCCVCHKLLFKGSVKICNEAHYIKMTKSDLDQCISDKYLHKCDNKCPMPCNLYIIRGSLWVCHTCNGKMIRGTVPAECASNNLELEPVPSELSQLNTLEAHLISPHIMFMKLMALPKTNQAGIHGPIVCVPNNINNSCDKLLPRSDSGGLLPVKLKRKLTYKGHYEYQYVDTEHLKDSLAWLIENNIHFKDFKFNDEWINTLGKQIASDDQTDNTETPVDDTAEDEHLYDNQQHGVIFDSCSMPLDVGQEALDQYFDGVISLAPAEGNNPVRTLNDKTNEAKCFPTIFPTGTNTFHTPRQCPLTLSKYFKVRLLNADTRCANNLEYLFYADATLILYNVISSVSIAVRKGHMDTVSEHQSKGKESLKHVVQLNGGYRFLAPIPGSPPFWSSVQGDVFAFYRQFGLPTWFCSFSAADLRWQNLLEAMLIQEGRTQTVEDLNWADKCDLLRNNPLLAARMFDFRWHCFLNLVLKSPANPIGKIVDYFYRIEFQARGSAHVHALFWIEGAPKLNVNTDAEVIDFIDKYVTCEIPSDNEKKLQDIVTTVQRHSKKHSKTCRKKNTVCRFNFPRPPSTRTFIMRPKLTPKCPKCHNKEQEAQCICQPHNPNALTKEEAEIMMSKIKKTADAVCDFPITTVELFESLNVTQDTMEEAYHHLGGRAHIVLKREVNAVYINQYNKTVLSIWDANIDIQFVTDPYALVVYVIGYMTKSEREMGLLLNNASNEALEGNESAKDAMKKIGQVYLHNREISAQEAAYRVCSLHLKEFSRKVVFVPTGNNITRLTKPIKLLDNSDCDSIWMTNIIDRYKNRPNDDRFNDMCMATFVSEYRILSKNEKSKHPILLQNLKGAIAKRICSSPACVKFIPCPERRDPEVFYQTLLQMYFPYRVEEDLKPEPCKTFREFYDHGQVTSSHDLVRSVKSVVEAHRKLFDKHSEDLEQIKSTISYSEHLETAWCKLCPIQQLERLEAKEEEGEKRHDKQEYLEEIPDLAITSADIHQLEHASFMSRCEGLELIRTLNSQQRSIFSTIRQWCLEKTSGQNPKPLHVFITGGAGTGKSHLIRAIQYEATRLLAPLSHSPENISVLITAPTGIAAYNLKAATIHSAFSIGRDISNEYVALGEDKINALRAKYMDVQIVIIDEISMVSHRLLTYIHGRLRQIKKHDSSFGNVTVLAVGDFFQLPPVRSKALYTQVGYSLWETLFKVTELTTVVRQTDHIFASLLNRLRTRSKSTDLLQADINLLKKRETGQESNALHILPTNKQVYEHNLKQLKKTCPDYITIKAQDYCYDKKVGKLVEMAGVLSEKRTSLLECLPIGINARVMLCRNIDINDGLVNGVVGTVTHIDDAPNKRFPAAIFVKFDDNKVGAQMRSRTHTPPDLSGSVRIVPLEDEANKRGERRRQYPLKLAWACTVHKVQGITVDEAVVSLKKIFSPGQAYVALSRVRTLEGLIIQHFKEETIYCNDNITTALNSMAHFEVTTPLQKQDKHVFTLFYMNVQGLSRHLPDLNLCIQDVQPNCIAVTETWIGALQKTHQIAGYNFHSQPRRLSYKSSQNVALLNLSTQQHGGVGIYCKEQDSCNIVTLQQFNLEILATYFLETDILIVVIYRPPSYPLKQFKHHLGELTQWLDLNYNNVAIVGDFNEDILKSSNLQNFMLEKGYTQHVISPTTERGTLIDHMYLKSSQFDIDTWVEPTYFSDHEAIMCCFRCKDTAIC